MLFSQTDAMHHELHANFYWSELIWLSARKFKMTKEMGNLSLSVFWKHPATIAFHVMAFLLGISSNIWHAPIKLLDFVDMLSNLFPKMFSSG